MKKMIKLLGFLTVLTVASNSIGLSKNGKLIDKIRLMPEDIPQGFIYGIIPNTYKTTLKSNPWEFDDAAIQKLAGKIYPGGDFKQISGIHVTIIARKETPHRDDIVCYIIQYKDNIAARDEIKKISEYAGYNQDRALLHVKNNVVIFLFVDNISNFQVLQELDKKITDRMQKS